MYELQRNANTNTDSDILVESASQQKFKISFTRIVGISDLFYYIVQVTFAQVLLIGLVSYNSLAGESIWKKSGSLAKYS